MKLNVGDEVSLKYMVDVFEFSPNGFKHVPSSVWKYLGENVTIQSVNVINDEVKSFNIKEDDGESKFYPEWVALYRDDLPF